MPTAHLSLLSHSGSGIFQGMLDFSFVPQPGQIIDMSGHPDRSRFPAIEESEPYFAVVTVFWGYDSGQMIPFITASYSFKDGGVFPEEIYEANRLFYPFAASRLGE